MEYINKYKEFANQIDMCDDEEVLSELQKEISYASMKTEFWKQRKLFFNSTDVLERKKAFLKQQWIQQFFNCSIPAKRSVKAFQAPNGLHGIIIDPKVVVGENCTIYQQVYIGVNTLLDSENHGIPQIGNQVYIGPGTKIMGNVIIGDNVRIDPNCYITEDIPRNSYVKNCNGSTIVCNVNLDNTYLPTKKYLDKYFAGDVYVCKETDCIEVFQAEPSDIDSIMKLYKDRVNWFKWKNVSQWTYYLVHHPREEFLNSIKKGNYYIIKLNQKIIAGFVISTESENWEDDTSNAYYLSRAVIQTGYKNVGPALIEHARNIAIADGKDSLRLECVYTNERLNNLWDGLGFKFVRDIEADYHASLREMKFFADTDRLEDHQI